jgi:hypothetical protein
MDLFRALPALLLATAVAGCTTLNSDLQKAQSLYSDARYEDALSWLAQIEREEDAMAPGQRARFNYLRGMTAFRLGQRDDALHYLALASALLAEDDARLPDRWRPVMRRTLDEITPRDASPHAQSSLRPDTL